MVNLVIPEHYGQVLLVIVMIAMECQLTAYFIIPPARAKVFNKKFMMENFGEEH